MSGIELSKRAQAVLSWIKIQEQQELPIRQQSLAEMLSCSRRSIYRALKQLKEQGYLVETGKRQNRCKVYQLEVVMPAKAGIQNMSEPTLDSSLRWNDKDDVIPSVELPLFAQFFLKHCYETIDYNMYNFPNWEKFLPEATYKLRHIEKQDKFWRLMFDNLYLIQERETGQPCTWARLNNPDSTLFGVPYPNKAPSENIDLRMRTVPGYRPSR